MLTNAKPKFSKFYFPGMISLVLLPMACVVYLFADWMIPSYGRMEVIAFSKQEFSKFKKGMTIPDDMDNVNTYRKYYDISFTGNPGHDAEEHVRLKMVVNQLNKKVDFVNGVRVTFEAHCKYKDMVEALDDYYQNSEILAGFAMVDNKMYMYQPTLSNSAQLISVMHPIFIDGLGMPEQAIPFMVTFKKTLLEFCHSLFDFWPSVLAFIGMVYFAFSKERHYFLSKSTVSTNN